ncbi:hypothetical protein TGMAS_209740 [Toxoplasma gondii MAS]|uniref:Uncharacterized protein n=1 Tax=Toxoplasma gondii MAS TaxID=943118 RepID=A0A086QS58_TOXGO|nr:hypothetical protein TGMAS_209740 [Toxoplasma gondii MAS]
MALTEAEKAFPSAMEVSGEKAGIEPHAFADSTDNDSSSEQSRDERESLLRHPRALTSTVALSASVPDSENSFKDSESSLEEGNGYTSALLDPEDSYGPTKKEAKETKGDTKSETKKEPEGETKGDRETDAVGEEREFQEFQQSSVAAACVEVIAAMKEDEFFAEASRLIRRERFRYLEGIRMMKEDHSYLDLADEDNGAPSKLVALMDALAQSCVQYSSPGFE